MGERYGTELILDLHDCKPTTFTRRNIRKCMRDICRRIGMTRGPLYWWDDKWTLPWRRETEPHLKGTTAIQFIRTSDIRIHALDLQRAVRLNVFSCAEFDPDVVKLIAIERFGGRIVNESCFDRM